MLCTYSTLEGLTAANYEGAHSTVDAFEFELVGDTEWILPGSLNELSMKRCGLTNLKTKTVSGAFNLTCV